MKFRDHYSIYFTSFLQKLQKHRYCGGFLVLLYNSLLQTEIASFIWRRLINTHVIPFEVNWFINLGN